MALPEIRRAISGHIPPLDGVRGVAIILVLISHLDWTPPVFAGRPREVLVNFAYTGWTGVELFFVLSGFLITGILLDSKRAENYFSLFYIRRALRILPLSYATLFAAFILFPLLGRLGVPHFPRIFYSAQLWCWFYVGNWAPFWHKHIPYFGHFWSLAVEEQFYLVWPCVVYMTRRRTLTRTCLALALVAQVLKIALAVKGVDVYNLTTSHLDSLGLGALAALIVRDEKWIRRLFPHLKHFISGIGHILPLERV